MYTHRVSVAPTSRATVICLHERFHQIGLAQNNAPSATIAELINSAYYTRRQQNSTTNNDALRHFIVSDRQLLTLLAHSKRQGLCNDTASVRLSACLSVRLSVPSIDRCSSVRRVCCQAIRGQAIVTVPSFGCHTPLRRVCCCGPGGRAGDIDDSGGGRAPSSTAHSSTAFSSKREQ